MITRKLSFALRIIFLFAFVPLANARNGIYLTLDGGWARQTGLQSVANVGALRRETRSLSALRVGVGYNHDLCNCFGIGADAGLGRYGHDTYVYEFANDIQIYSTTTEFFALATYHLRRWDIIGKVGGIRQTVHFTGRLNQTQINPEFFIGTAYYFNPHFAATVSYAYVPHDKIRDFNSLRKKTPGLEEVFMGLRYTF